MLGKAGSLKKNVTTRIMGLVNVSKTSKEVEGKNNKLWSLKV
jgi:hypothetical protein